MSMKVINEEMEKLSVLEIQSAEYAVCRNYLDWLTIFLGEFTAKRRHDLKKAEEDS